MAMVKLDSSIVDIEGKTGGTVFRYDNCGQHAQAFPRLIKKRTRKQDFVRSAFSDLSYVWKSYLTKHEQDTWYIFARNYSYPGKKGNIQTLPGRTMYLQYNLPPWWKGEPPLWIAPGFTPEPEHVAPYEAWWPKWVIAWLFRWEPPPF
ncbi:MAG: hypothetical protein E3J94_03630 [Desulfobacteraceae bacterium]|nr:MAG: hypothetical protein E3J94_03630 [Desulfobacteraceae bacterium]